MTERAALRDPRVNPKVGDVLLMGVNRVTVTERTSRRILYTLTIERGASPIYRIPMHCGLYLNRWKEVVEHAEVIHHAD